MFHSLSQILKYIETFELKQLASFPSKITRLSVYDKI